MQLKKLTLHYKNYLPILLIGSFSFLINYYYGFIGLMPMDNTVLYNGGYRVLNGFIPFNDYWLVTGPLLDYLNAFFFKIFGVSWKTFIIHSSLINLLLAVSTYFLFIKLKLSNKYSLLYSAFVSILFYPVVGTPFVDHHSTFFLILAFYSLILAINEKNYYYYLAIPTLFSLSFLSKQTPAAYGLILATLSILLFCYFDKKNAKKIIYFSIIGSFISIIFLFLFFFSTGIDLSNFFTQYLLFASSIGDSRFLDYKFNIFNEISNFKYLFYFILLLTVITFNKILKKNFKTEDIFTILISILLVFSLIIHQMLTLNQNYIFFLIPYLCGITHIFYKKSFNKEYLLIFSVLVCIFSVTKYHIRFNEQRKFNELEKVDISKAIDAENLSESLRGLRWITYKYPENPTKELENLKNIIKILTEDKSKKTLITDYQILAPISGIYDYSPNQWHHPSVSFPVKDQKYFNVYRNFFTESLKKNQIKFIFETSEEKSYITELILGKNCLKKKRLDEMLIKFELIKTCKDLK